MPRITLDQQTFELDGLPPAAQALIQRMRYAQSEIARLQVIQNHLNTLQCNAYEALCQMLQTATSEDPPD